MPNHTIRRAFHGLIVWFGIVFQPGLSAVTTSRQIDFHGDNLELATSDQVRLGASAGRAPHVKAAMLEFLSTCKAPAFGMHFLHAKLASTHELVIFAQDVPCEIERLGHHLAHITDAQRHGDHAQRPGIARSTRDGLEDTGNDPELVHAALTPPRRWRRSPRDCPSNPACPRAQRSRSA